ncbi:bifunctional phosphopantothenoylcysteine decarboxylase/phosphopantothenate--cysteine ligase CoaBC [Streptobacillus moniliformis]|uniref:Coenzyme A biosynthesis bifunctional protein CoaBC n=1 Tax=Streptobacillus moniliformis (strain ATCC 14647 / DSM 12112 / NCTC 10651 / 9901) TaxID=519441 RepID=D1AY29_STRM9|nr:bifunctional phosphopantothenoylcysteine decarboxylase/phosphopantothenate--cysteine ligase CoaBC [Streptobacillus moniliformis]ACZ01205.1 phosphopantothenoylcysteine decarboxylase/phosphopantothenate/cysteine ligase [Streptobacillus moniliformis DSM 12112]AVL42438.1 bifunctional phosphopantothenoylcysteine decarboxylase/phosphopantothenate--cysteine ligase CoaBC [Streptobacillus moniliformis]SQA13643.1 DNA/pantothenate metabolism flavoprotein [Streptobacillus moniliformis]
MKNIVIGVTSGIACYKALDVCSKLKKNNYNIKVIMTENASKLISPLLFQTLTGNKVYINMFDENETSVSHIEIAKNSDLVCVIPATYNIIGKLSNGIADDFLSTFLSVCDPRKVMIFPAMNTNMYLNPILQGNLEKLSMNNYNIVQPATGSLACGDFGLGKLPEVDIIVDKIMFNIEKTDIFKNKKILITAGGTVENIDTVRHITNKSSGKMGYALAKQATLQGADVTLISTKPDLKTPHGISKIIYIENADEMHEAVLNNIENIDYIFMVAAVSDFKIKNYSDTKIKKNKLKDLKLELELNVDILKKLSEIKPRKFKLIGFAAEDNNLKENAKAKLINKKLDYIVLNDISNKAIGFNSDNNKVFIFDKNGNEIEIKENTKDIVAKEILFNIVN